LQLIQPKIWKRRQVGGGPPFCGPPGCREWTCRYCPIRHPTGVLARNPLAESECPGNAGRPGSASLIVNPINHKVLRLVLHPSPKASASHHPTADCPPYSSKNGKWSGRKPCQKRFGFFAQQQESCLAPGNAASGKNVSQPVNSPAG